MTPTVLIATHKREQVTTRNIYSLLRQSVRPKICLIVSDSDEYKYYNRLGCELKLVNAPNFPLGLKWQLGVDACKDADPLIILGSDDILGDGFIENACRLIEAGNHFIGLRQWWQHKAGKAYFCQYLAKEFQPIGGGRVYSNEMLKKIRYSLFDTSKSRNLDDLGYQNCKSSGLQCLVLEQPDQEGLAIHAIKGDWPMINQFQLHHKNVRLIRTESAAKLLPDFYYPYHNKENGNSFA